MSDHKPATQRVRAPYREAAEFDSDMVSDDPVTAGVAVRGFRSFVRAMIGQPASRKYIEAVLAIGEDEQAFIRDSKSKNARMASYLLYGGGALFGAIATVMGWPDGIWAIVAGVPVMLFSYFFRAKSDAWARLELEVEGPIKELCEWSKAQKHEIDVERLLTMGGVPIRVETDPDEDLEDLQERETEAILSRKKDAP